ncbi:SDR family NAD(P)-dependent oxidoreductase [Hirschia baltica]|uniref:Short-chain dehydrogenase/reductase SDR n=1 Tax=Hirschia baltica (strain ATCC 49814 / DSM 5838 / IFAM 1418) TaxID=582402 RepID=C6XP54_HIRBI|nr:SDR family oxidoreductase [Hirschia baltica]ACT60234.1 short-chain dehydrogenase/reductase SDR [Hirschia baltica ATCC 49814]
MRLKNKLVVVTAAASGIGKEGVLRFIREGARVAAIDVNADALGALVLEIGDDTKIVTITADLSTPKGAKDSIDSAAELLGGIDILWAHAGTPGPAKIENLDMKAYDFSFALNVTSAVIASDVAAEYMRARGGGSLIFTSSVSGLVGSMFSPLYSTAKFAIVGLAKSLALGLAKDGIRVNAICPGLTETPMMNGFISRKGDPTELEENGAVFKKSIPLARFGRPEEIADVALWLASDESSYVTGVALPVDGGYSAR